MKFSLDLNRAIYNTKGTSVANQRENVIFSPLSVAVALSLVLLGSAGRTFDEVSRVLGLESGVDISQHSEIVHQTFGQLLDFANYRIEGSNKPRVDSASGVFVQVHIQCFISIILDNYIKIYTQCNEISKSNPLSKSIKNIFISIYLKHIYVYTHTKY